MKTSILNTRISTKAKDNLETIAATKGKAISEVTRDAIDQYLKSETEPSHSPSNDKVDLIQSLSFTELIDWVYRKRIDPEVNEITTFTDNMVEIINEMDNHNLFYPEILTEFKKISSELVTMHSDSTHDESYYNFPRDGNNGFCYDKLSDFMCCIRYADDKVTKVLFIK